MTLGEDAQEKALDALEEKLKARYRVFYRKLGMIFAVVALICGSFLFGIQKILTADGALEPTRTIVAAADGLMAFLFLVRRKFLLAAICVVGAMATIAYFPWVASVTG